MIMSTILKTTRLPFLVLSPVCVFLGVSTSLAVVPTVDYFLVSIILMGALASQISINTLNEYYDFKTGLDLITNKTAFSGGSGALPANPEAAGKVLAVGLVTLLLTMVVGVYLVATRGSQILPIGVLGVAVVISYTQWLNKIPWLCLVSPGFGAGVLIVVGTQVVLVGEYSAMMWLVSLISFCLLNNILLLCQYPDIDADTKIGRKTFPIVYGLHKSNFVYAGFMITAYGLILLGLVVDLLPAVAIVSMAPLLLSLYALFGAVRHKSALGQYPQYMAANVAVGILTPSLLALSIGFGTQ